MINREILKSDQTLVQKVIDYFAAEYIDIAEWEIIKMEALENGKKYGSPNYDKFANMGFLSVLDCTLYLSKRGYSNGGRVIDETIKALQEGLIIYPIDMMLNSRLTDERFRFNGTVAANLYKKKLIINIILGFEHIVEKYKKSIFKIEPTYSNKNKSIGTGFIINYNREYYVVTNKHVIQDSISLKILDIDDNNIEFGSIFKNPTKDVAIIKLSNIPAKSYFFLNFDYNVLDEIITIGYPSVPMTKFAYQLCHKGEINSVVEDYFGNKLLIFSAKTSSGNSGSPLIDKTGRVIGIVTQELFEEEEFYKKGKLPYYAALTSSVIVETIKLGEEKVLLY